MLDGRVSHSIPSQEAKTCKGIHEKLKNKYAELWVTNPGDVICRLKVLLEIRRVGKDQNMQWGVTRADTCFGRMMILHASDQKTKKHRQKSRKDFG